MDDQVGGDGVRVHDARQRHPAVGEALRRPRCSEEVEPETAVLLGNGDPEEGRAPSSARRLRPGRVCMLHLRRDGVTSRAMKRCTVATLGEPRDRWMRQSGHARNRTDWEPGQFHRAGTVRSDDGSPHAHRLPAGRAATPAAIEQRGAATGADVRSSVPPSPARRFRPRRGRCGGRRGGPAVALSQPARQRDPRQGSPARRRARGRGDRPCLRERFAVARSALVLRPPRKGLIDLRVAMFDHVQRMPLAFFTRAQTGALQSRLNTDVVGAQQAVTSTLGLSCRTSSTSR